MNCCRKGKYECGEYKSTDAHSGVRVMNEYQRDFYALAVQKAAAAWNMTTCQPTFVHWLEKPQHEKSAMYDDYVKSFLSGVLQFFCFQIILICVVIATTMLVVPGHMCSMLLKM